MEALVLAAGLGTRLLPLTADRPKALVEVAGKPLIEHVIRRLERAGIRCIVVNVHHFADKVERYIYDQQWQSSIAISDERAQLLDTGGALKHAAHLFSGTEAILVHNVDIISDIDLLGLERYHHQQRHLATLCVCQRDTTRKLLFDAGGMLVGRATDAERSADMQTLAFSGVSVVEPQLLPLLPTDDRPYPIIDQYIRLAANGYAIGSYRHSAEHWLDVGKPNTLAIANQWIPFLQQ